MPMLPVKEQETGDELKAKLLGETARAPWRELQRFFAQGVLLAAEPGVDLIEVGMALAEDNREAFEPWLESGRVGVVTDAQALQWSESDATLWTMVIKPWVLVQQTRD